MTRNVLSVTTNIKNSRVRQDWFYITVPEWRSRNGQDGVVIHDSWYVYVGWPAGSRPTLIKHELFSHMPHIVFFFTSRRRFNDVSSKYGVFRFTAVRFSFDLWSRVSREHWKMSEPVCILFGLIAVWFLQDARYLHTSCRNLCPASKKNDIKFHCFRYVKSYLLLDKSSKSSKYQ